MMLHHTIISVEHGVSSKFEVLRPKTYSLVMKNYLYKKHDMITQVSKDFYSSIEIVEAVGGSFCFCTMYSKLSDSSPIVA